MVVIGKGTLAIFEGAEDRIGAFKPTVSGRFGPIGVFPGEKSPCATQAVEKQRDAEIGHVPSEFRSKRTRRGEGRLCGSLLPRCTHGFLGVRNRNCMGMKRRAIAYVGAECPQRGTGSDGGGGT